MRATPFTGWKGKRSVNISKHSSFCISATLPDLDLFLQNKLSHFRKLPPNDNQPAEPGRTLQREARGGGGWDLPAQKPLAFLPGHLIAAVRSPCFQWRLLQPLGGALPRHCPPRRWRRRLPPRAGAGRAAPPYWLLSCLKAAAAVAASGVSGGEQQRHYRRRAAAATAWGAGQA